MNFVYYDLIFLVLFGILGSYLMYKNKKSLKREMKVFFMYRTKVGMKLIDYIGGKYKKTLNALKYPIIIIGYILMAGILYLMGSTVYQYIKYPQITEIIKAPPLAPVIPYFPKLFGMESFFPPFYFTYFLVAITIVMLVHEFSHGIFMKRNKVKIKNTGLLFIGPMLSGAFVEQDEKSMEKASKTEQMTILAAGVFANIIFAGIFFLLWWGLFTISFVPSGAIIGGYPAENVLVNNITMFGGVALTSQTPEQIIKIIEQDSFTKDIILDITLDDKKQIILTKIVANNKNYYGNPEIIKKMLKNKEDYLPLLMEFPAIKQKIKGNIIQINDQKIKDSKTLQKILKNYKPGDKIKIKTEIINHNGENQIKQYEIILAQNPYDKNKAFIGITSSGFSKKIENQFSIIFKDPHTYYKTKSNFLIFLYYLVFWIFLLNLLVAFFNMLPFAILDGGRFFLLTIWGITRNEKIAKNIYKGLGIIILASFALLMLIWFIRII